MITAEAKAIIGAIQTAAIPIQYRTVATKIAADVLEMFYTKIAEKNDNPTIKIGAGHAQSAALTLLCHCHIARESDTVSPQVTLYSNLARSAIKYHYKEVFSPFHL